MNKSLALYIYLYYEQYLPVLKLIFLDNDVNIIQNTYILR